MRTTNSRFQPTDAVLDIPLPLAETLYPSDLTASQLRAAIVMLSRVNADGRFEILKTQLEAAADVNVDRIRFFLVLVHIFPRHPARSCH